MPRLRHGGGDVAGGDVILQAGGRRTAAPGDIAAAVTEARHAGRDSVLLMLSHNGRRVFVPLKLDPAQG